MSRTHVVLEQIANYLGLGGHSEKLRVLLDLYTTAYIMDLEENEAAADAEEPENTAGQLTEEPKPAEETHTQTHGEAFSTGSTTADQAAADEQETYRGFLHLRCPHCGEIKSFCAKTPISSYYCNECHSKSVMENISFASVECECGKRWMYQTNITDWGFDITCLGCAAPVAVEYNSGAGQFVTIGSHRMRKKKKR